MRHGDRIASRFELLGEAGRGGMGTVFRARDHRDRRDVALKVLAANTVDGVARFEREATILAGIHHPNVVEHVAHGVVPDGPCWLAMEWVEGETLAARLDRRGVAPSEAIELAIQLARALGALHAQGVVHRDVKPSNVMLVGGDVARVKLVDLGVARRALDAPALTRSGAMVGTIGYMAPEQARGERELDARADLFALGCVLHECLTGAPAFRGDSTIACRAKVLLATAPRLRQVVPAVPAELDALVASLLARRAGDRPADAAAVERALAALPALPATMRPRPAPAHERASTTYVPPSQALAIAVVLVLHPDRGALVRATSSLHDATIEPIDGGVAITVLGDDGTAQRLARAVARAVPDALIAIAGGDTLDGVIDRAARVLDEAQLAAEARGVPARGAWTRGPRGVTHVEGGDA